MKKDSYSACVNQIEPGITSSLISRNITIMGRRTSVRLEPEMWTALNDIANREQCTVHDICTLIYIRKNISTSLTAAIRVFLMLYFRAATNEQGHNKAGHGDFNNMKKRAQIPSEYEVFFKRKRSSMRNLDRSNAVSLTFSMMESSQ